MSTSTREALELLRLFKCVVDTGTDVLAAFAKVKLLRSFNGNFKQFLDDKKHEIFHLWQSQKLLCCKCPPTGYNIIRKSHMDDWIFKKIYDGSGPEERRHIVRISGNVVQVCLHKYVSRNIAIDELDISVISFLLRNLAVLSHNEKTTLDIITTTRSQICHAYSTNCYSMILLNAAWTVLENALVDLADPSYKRIIQKQIKYMRKVDLEKEEVTELLENVQEINLVLHELSEVQITNNNLIRNGFKTQDRKIVDAKDEMIQNQNMQFGMLYKGQAEIKEQIQQLTAIYKVFFQQNSSRTETQNTTSAENKDESDTEKSTTSAQSETGMTGVDEWGTEMYVEQGAKPKKLNRHETEVEKGNVTLQTGKYSIDMEKKSMEVKAEESSKQNVESEDRSQVRATCQVEGKDINESSAVQSLPDTKHNIPSDLSISIISAEKKCILLELEVPSKVLEDKVLFRVALRALIVKIAHAGKIDINKQSTITLLLTFKDDLTEDIIKEIHKLSDHSNISCTIDSRLKNKINPNEDWLKQKYAWLENENITLMAENSQLFTEIFAQREEISILKIELEKHQERTTDSPSRLYSSAFLQRPTSSFSPSSDPASQFDSGRDSQCDSSPGDPWDSGAVNRRTISYPRSVNRRTISYPRSVNRRIQAMPHLGSSWMSGSDSPSVSGPDSPLDSGPVVYRRRIEAMPHLVVNRKRTSSMPRFVGPEDSGSESMSEDEIESL